MGRKRKDMAGVWRKLYEERFKILCLSSNVTKI